MKYACESRIGLPEPSQWPMPMARFGLNPHGEPLYRVVFAPTVRRMIFGEFADGYVGARVRRSYPALGNKWILEKWISGWDDTKMSPAEYETWGPRDPKSGLLINGPYPYLGTYNEVYTFDNTEDVSGVHLIVEMVERGAKRSASEVAANNRELDQKQEKEAAEERFLRVRNLEPLYGARPASFPSGPKAVNHKSQRTPLSANELGLPTGRGKIVAGRGPTVHASI
jgi:hypothetical protein